MNKMSPANQFDRELAHLDKQLSEELISEQEYNEQVVDLERDYRAAAEEAAQEAYCNEFNSW